MICVGIDAGSRAIKIVLLDSETLKVVASGVADQGTDQVDKVESLLDELLGDHDLKHSDVARTVATGYARNIIATADKTITEITCHAKGVAHRHADARTVIEIGGQDSKVIRLGTDGQVEDFAMNDRCAAGTGCFLEMVAKRLEVDLSAIGQLATQSTEPAQISSMCAVFAETEIIGLLSSGIAVKDIAAGVQHSIARRIASMLGRKIVEPVWFTGGVALLPGMQQALEQAINMPINLAATPQMTGALGAAILAASQLSTCKVPD